MHSRDPILTTRVATAADAEAVHGLLVQLSRVVHEAHLYTGTPEKLVNRGLGGNSVFTVLLLESKGKIVGMSLFYPEFSSWRCSTGVYVQDIVVDESFRGGGGGKVLLEAVIRYALLYWNASYMKLAVHSDNREAQNFYEKHGFQTDLGSQVMLLEADGFARLRDSYEQRLHR